MRSTPFRLQHARFSSYFRTYSSWPYSFIYRHAQLRLLAPSYFLAAYRPAYIAQLADNVVVLLLTKWYLDVRPIRPFPTLTDQVVIVCIVPPSVLLHTYYSRYYHTQKNRHWLVHSRGNDCSSFGKQLSSPEATTSFPDGDSRHESRGVGRPNNSARWIFLSLITDYYTGLAFPKPGTAVFEWRVGILASRHSTIPTI
ncbi:hypothetical protein RclHR1_22230006 [Rhizophagus clarus]|uniref:Uncharacterized protein n=1 Tax=Rhizophagus clarus TaxID=94130 RepID=A0A2Z6QW16_9GLOM|nr:hypothetical protein RclHR1_22230006 [Rhizophagus clarus]